MGIIGSVRRTVSQELKKYASHATLYDGVLNGTGLPFRCLIVENTNFGGHLIARTYMENPRILKKWRIWIPALKRTLEKREDGIDICIAVLPASYELEFHGLYDFRGHEWVNQALDVSGGWEGIKKRFHEKQIRTERRIRQYAFTYRISNDTKDFDLFYHDMYLPHTQRQFGEFSYVETYEEVLSYFMRGFLLFVLDGGRPVTGLLCVPDGNALKSRRAGVLHGDKEYISKGAQASLYYFLIRYANEKGFAVVDFMKCRPFLDDGIYMHKRGWGATVNPDNEAETAVYYSNVGEPEKITGFYENNPLIIPADGMVGIVGWRGTPVISEESKKELRKHYYAPGIKGLRLILPDSSSPIDISYEETSKVQT